MSYVISGIGATAAALIAPPTQLPPGAVFTSRNTNGPAPGDKFIAVPTSRNTNGPAPGDAFVPTPVRTMAPTLAPTLAPAAASFDWKPWAIGAVVLGGGLYLLFR